jgi:amino acid adenylation domain-containing protein/thioester reductase-like protein
MKEIADLDSLSSQTLRDRFPVSILSKPPVHYLFETKVSQNPDAIALIGRNGSQVTSLTYQALNDRANQLAYFLQSQGVKPDTPVGLCVDRSFDLMISVLAILKAGGAYLPLDPSYPAERLAYMLTHAQAPLMLTQSHLLPDLPTDAIQSICLDKEAQEIAQHGIINPRSNVEAEHLAYVIYTSGSTGLPKAVAMPHLPLSNLINWQQCNSVVGSGAKTLQFTPISFDVSFQEIFATLTTGGTLVLIDDETRRDSIQLLKFLNETAIERLFLPFVALQHLAESVQATKVVPLHLREVITAGEQLRITPAIANCFSQMPDCTLHNHYGPSETHVVAAYKLTGSPEQWELLPPVGQAIDNANLYVLNEDLQLASEGELYIGGACLAKEYLNRPDLTQERFINNPLPGHSTERLYKTGDLARYLPDGNLQFLGRIDQQVKIRGFRVELGEIEAVLEKHPAVREAVVTLRQEIHPRLVAHAIAHTTVSIEEVADLPKQLRQFLKTQLPDYMLPSVIVMLDEFPLTPSGKLDRRNLPLPEFPIDQDNLVLPRSQTEVTVAAIWAEVLGLPQVSIDDDFLALGGHSLLATQVISRIRIAFEIDLPLRVMFETSTIRQLAEKITVQQTLQKTLQTTLQHDIQQPLRPIAREGNLPLASVQEPLWFLDQLVPNHPFYNVPEAFQLTGALNVKVLEQSLQTIVDRHEALRTNFAIVNGRPTQVVHPQKPFTLDIVDVKTQINKTSTLPITQQETELGRLILSEARRPFNLSKDILFRATLFRVHETEHILFVNLHHIICDGWSIGILLQELSTLYLEGGSSQTALPKLTIQFADFAVWQRQGLQPKNHDRQLAYWRQKLADLPPMLQLPSTSPRPAVASYQGARHFFNLSDTVTHHLNRLGQREGTTLFMTLLGAFQTLLFRYSGQDDIAIGSLLANRQHPELEKLLGFFSNTIVLRTDLSGQPTFRQLLQRVRETTLEAYANQDLLFDQLVQTLHPDRDLNQNPLVQVVFNLQNTPIDWTVPELSLTRLPLDNRTVKFDLFLELTETPTGLSGYFEYSTDLFTADTISRLAEHFQILLTEIATNPDQSLSDLPLSTPIEKQQFQTWNQTESEIPHRCIHQLFEAQVERTPDAIAVEFNGQSLTYHQLNQRSNQVAHHLRKLGVKAETLVGLSLERSIEMLIGLLGILKAGGAYVPLDPTYPEERLAFMVEDAQLSLVLSQTGICDRFTQMGAKGIAIENIINDRVNGAEQNFSNIDDVDCNGLAYVIYTSGSTGNPKGVEITHRSAVNFLLSMQQEFRLTPKDTLLAVTTISFDIAVLELYLPLLAGAHLIIASQNMTRDAHALMETIERSQVSLMQATPATWRMLLAAGWQGNSRLSILCGGEALTEALAQQLLERCATLWNMYGPTETTVWSTMSHITAPTPITVGRPIANTQIHVLDSQLQLVPIGVPGELYIGGEGLARGYLNRLELTAQKFVPNPFDQFSTRLYRTGDLARYRPDGNLEIIGRADDQVKIRGFRIELGDVESALSQHSAVEEAIVIAREDQPGDKRLVAYVVTKSEAKLNPTDLPRSDEATPQTHLQTEQLQQWQTIYDEAYSQSTQDIENSSIDTTFNTAIWNSSYTGLPYPVEEMQEWVDHTVERILALKPSRVLEIGCGTGLLLFRVAPHCAEYFGCDLSQAGIRYIEQQLQHQPEKWSQVKLSNRSADAIDDLEPETFDTIVINSVIQYFPSIEYLVQVLEKAVKLVKPGGQIFIGDVRCLSLLQSFHTSVQLHQASDSLSKGQLQELIQENMNREVELLINSDFFAALQHKLPNIHHVDLQLKRGKYHNEMTCFRYDVVLHIDTAINQSDSGTDADLTPAQPQVWHPAWTVAKIQQQLQDNQPPILALTQVQNARMAATMNAMKTLSTLADSESIAPLKASLKHCQPTGIDPETLWNLSRELPYRVLITGSIQPDCFDVIFQHSQITQTKQQQSFTPTHLPPQSWQSYGNNPLQTRHTSQLVQQLQRFLKEKLPEFMVPSTIVLMDALPRTLNGKVNRRALPTPSRERPNLKLFTAPRTPTEKQLARIWGEALGIDRVGIHDNFFELGGYSILAAQVLAQIQKTFHIELSLLKLFLSPTIEQLAQGITEGELAQSTSLDQANPIDLRSEVVLDPTITAKGEAIVVPANVLLTGASGFFGAFLLHELLQQTTATIYCLVRATDVKAGLQRVQRNLEKYSLWQPHQSNRIIPILGNLAEPRLGLSEPSFQALSATIDTIYHNGAQANFIYPYSLLKATNVLGTEEVLRLAGQTRTKSVHFISSLGVFCPIGYKDGQMIRAQDQPDRLEGLYGYTQSKWVAEQLIHLAQERGIPATIHRPAWIEGHSQTGVCNQGDFLRTLVKGCIHMGIAPDWNMPIDTLPVDYLSRVIVHLSSKPESAGSTFNFSNPRSLMWTQLVDWMVQFGYSLKVVPYAQWLTTVKEQAQNRPEHPLYPFLSFLIDSLPGYQQSVPEIYFQTNLISFDTQNIQDGVADIASDFPALDDRLLTTYFSYFIRSGFLPTPGNF